MDPTPTPDLANQLRQSGVENLIVSMGEKGALILSGDNMMEVPGADVHVVDTTGAGDGFNAGLAVAIAQGWELVEAVKFANCAGALTCIKLGVIPALGKRDMVAELYAKTYT